jgi:prolyl-tRNA editing enzyme YbaK/EbsC (Cys-tRNA(Pro) deacylase)
MDYRLNPRSQKVQEYLHSMGVDAQVREMPATTRTAKEAAQAIGCSVAQIAKSMVFRTEQSGRAVLVIASAANRVDERRMSELIGEQIEKATPEFVRESTGFGIGGVPPVGHCNPVETWIGAICCNLTSSGLLPGRRSPCFRFGRISCSRSRQARFKRSPETFGAGRSGAE